MSQTSDLADVIGYVDSDDESEYPEGWKQGRFSWFKGPRIGPVDSLNELTSHAKEYDAIGIVTDDAKLTSPGWDRWLLDAMDQFPKRICVVSPFHNHGSHVDMPFVSRQWVETVGWYACPEMRHYCWPIVTGLIGEMTAMIHAPADKFSVSHDYKDGTNEDIRAKDYESFFRFVSAKLPNVVERLRLAMYYQEPSESLAT